MTSLYFQILESIFLFPAFMAKCVVVLFIVGGVRNV